MRIATTWTLLVVAACREEPRPPSRVDTDPPAATHSAWHSAPDHTGTAPVTDGPDPACAVLGCLRSVTDYGAYTRAQIEPSLYGDFVLDNGYQIFAVEYVTQGGTATATVTLPMDLAGEQPPDGFPVVVNAHGTLGLDDGCRLAGTVSGTGLAALFGGRGAIGVAPDYPGLGTPGYGRYLDAESEATSVFDSIRASIHLARFQGVTTNERAAVVGLSQGGHASLAAAALHSRYAPELDIRAFGASAPANLYEEQWRSGVTFPGEHLVLHAMFAWSAAEVASADRSQIWAPGLTDTVDAHLTGRCYWSPSFGTEPLLTDGFPVEMADVFSPAFGAEYLSGDWTDFAFMGAAFDRNRIRPWLGEGTQTAPIAIWQGTADTTVLPWMTAQLVDDLRAGGIEVELHAVAGGTHTTTAFGFLAYPELATNESVAWVQGLLAAP